MSEIVTIILQATLVVVAGIVAFVVVRDARRTRAVAREIDEDYERAREVLMALSRKLGNAEPSREELMTLASALVLASMKAKAEEFAKPADR